MRYAEIARANGVGFILESPTWRASSDWGGKLGYSARRWPTPMPGSIGLMQELRDAFQSERTPMVVSGCVGPRGDGYDPGAVMSPDEAEAYHAEQIGVFAGTDADMVTAITMTNAGEAIGVTRAAQAAGMPVAISFTVETDGRLPTGQSLKEAIAEVDEATGSAPAYYMINCAHPTHFDATLAGKDGVARPHPRHPRQRLEAQPRRAQRGARPRRRRSRGAGRAVPGAACAAIRRSTCSAAAAAPTTATSRRSAPRASRRPLREEAGRAGALPGTGGNRLPLPLAPMGFPSPLWGRG